MKRRTLFSRPRTRKTPKLVALSPFFGLFGVVASLFLVVVVLQQTVPPRNSFVEPLPPPSFTTFLPSGATVSDAVLALPDAPQRSYIFGYGFDDENWIGVVVWDKVGGRYVFGAPLKLAATDTKITSVLHIVTQPLGNAGASVILVDGPVDDTTTGIFILKRQGNSVRFVTMIDPQGNTKPAIFLRGISKNHADEVVFEDTNSDGTIEAVRANKTLGAKNACIAETDEVYQWRDDRFVYDKNLSWAVTTSRSLFPEPLPEAVSKSKNHGRK